MKKIQVKVCGLREPDNIQQVAALAPDYLGFIFYRKSKRLVTEGLDLSAFTIHKVGVFVNAEIGEILEKVTAYELEVVQLHGEESPEFVAALKRLRPELRMWKAVGVNNGTDFGDLEAYNASLEAFLFDTASPQYGGTGKSFDWRTLDRYQGEIPFWLSGGIGPNSLADLIRFTHPRWVGIDLNSRFESSPGVKDTDLLGAFLASLKTKQSHVRSE